jgi:Ca2+-binding RTX toxin-like protein
VATYTGDGGNNSYTGTADADQAKGGGGDDILNGLGGNDQLEGEDGNDTLDGGSGNDSLYGGNDDDLLRSGSGIDQLSGGTGSDKLYFGADYGAGDVAAGGEGFRDFLVLQGSYTLTFSASSNLSGLEEVLLLSAESTWYDNPTPGANFSYNITIADDATAAGEDFGVDGFFLGAGESFHFDGSAETNGHLFALGGAADDVLIGGASSDAFLGGFGDDYLDGGAGADKLGGGSGNDTYIVDNEDEWSGITEFNDQGIDLVISSVNFQLHNDLENLTLTGTAINGWGNELDNIVIGNGEANFLIGVDGNDRLDGGLGADKLWGGTGNDTYIVDDAGDIVTEQSGEGSDSVISSVSYVLADTLETLTLIGTASIDGTGNYQANVITGNSGNNRLDGGGEVDTLIGGAGDDTYVLDNASETGIELAGEGIDTIEVGASYALGANLERLILTGSGNFSGTGNELANSLTGNSGNNVLDGLGGADIMAGGLGDDIYVVDNSGDKANEAAGAGNDLVLASATYVLGANIERLTLTGTGNITGVGNALNNVLIGNNGNNTLSGSVGADTMSGGLGNDIYIVDDAGDVVSELASQGTDTVQVAFSYTLGANVENLTFTGTSALNGTGNALDNVIIGNSAVNTLTGNAGNDTLNGGLGADNMAGGIGNDTYVVDEAGDVVTEASGAGTDTVQVGFTYTLGANLEVLTLTGTAAIDGTGNGLGNTLNGNSGANVLDGGAGIDLMFGGNGDDTYIVSDLGDRATEVSAAGGYDTVMSAVTFYMTSNIEKIVLTGTAAINAYGNSGDNLMIGNSGNNTLSGGLGADTMAGGLGVDIYVVDNAGDVVTENAGEGIDTVQSSLSYTLGAEVENLTLTGTATLNGTGNGLNNIITGNSGANTLTGGIGNDTLIGGVGNDTLIGGVGNDTYTIDGGDTLVEAAGEGTDTVQAAISYTLLSNFEVLTLTGTANINGTGNAADNILNGNAGNNVLDGGLGADLMFGGRGDDIYIVDNAGDRATEQYADGGTDTVISSVSFSLGTNVENLTLSGSGNVNGTGNALDNFITGNSGNNSLTGGAGADTLDGKLGTDSFLYTNTSDSTSGAMDHILGFGAGDKINLSGIDASTTAAGNNAFAFVGAAAFTNTAGELRAYQQSGSDWMVEADVNGDGVADLVISVSTDHALAAGDFVF